MDSLLEESIVDNIEALSLVLEVGGSGVSQLAEVEDQLWHGVLGDILWEDILWVVNVCAKFEVVDFSDVSFVEILSNQELIEVLSWWNDLQFLEHSSELLSCNVAALGPVVVLELWLDENALKANLSADCAQKSEECILLTICEVGSTLEIL